jgi:hypothetical protein
MKTREVTVLMRLWLFAIMKTDDILTLLVQLANAENQHSASIQCAYDLNVVNFQDVEISMMRRAIWKQAADTFRTLYQWISKHDESQLNIVRISRATFFELGWPVVLDDFDDGWSGYEEPLIIYH